jgi:hypothetical protein
MDNGDVISHYLQYNRYKPKTDSRNSKAEIKGSIHSQIEEGLMMSTIVEDTTSQKNLGQER